jgi:hypothetical protein
MAEWRDFDASNQPDTCLWCGRKLRHKTTTVQMEKGETWESYYARAEAAGVTREEKGGDYRDGFFCGLRCGYQFAERLAQLGRRLEEKTNA